MEFDGDKDAFCKAYKKNVDGIAERIQREVNMDTIKQERSQTAELTPVWGRSRCAVQILRAS